MSTPFKLKQFTINQDQCAMKIGTDGVLLGAWATLKNNPTTILDIGAGTGIIALMLAQRSNATIIDALEIDAQAYEQCVENFEASPWRDRLFCYHASLEEFTNEIDDKYNLIVCNPPFYTSTYKTENSSRNTARFQDAMPFKQLLNSASKLLSNDGEFCVIIPFSEETLFTALALTANLKVNAITHVKGTINSSIKRSLMVLSFRESVIQKSTLVIENERHNYTEDYINLTKDFYLKM